MLCDKMPFKRTHIFLALVCVAITLYAVQFFLLRKTQSLQTYSPEHARSMSRAYMTVKNFIALCDSQKVIPILVDPFILREIVSETFQEAQRPCRFLCKNHIYTFAIRGKQLDKFTQDVLPHMAAKGFELTVKYTDEKRQINASHILLRDHENHAIHVVILYHRGAYHGSQFVPHFWYDSFPHDDLGVDVGDFTEHEGLINEFEHPVVTIDGVELAIPSHPTQFIQEYQNSTYIPCNKTLNDQYFSKYPRDTSRRAQQFRDDANQALSTAKRLLDHLEVPFWLSSGTLLGWYRQCDYIVYSGDADIGIFIKDHTDDFRHQMHQAGMKLEHKFGRASDSLQYAYDMGDIKLDLFFFYEESDHMWNGGTSYDDGAKYKYSFPKFTLCWTEFMNMKVRVPCNPLTYLKANYGENWFYPIKNWDWKTSPNNVKEVEPWKTEELPDVIQIWDKNNKRVDLDWVEDKQELK